MTKKKRIPESFLKTCQRFDEACSCLSPPKTDIGIRQFYDYESTGKEPGNADPYFAHLLNGKKWWEWTLENYKEMFFEGKHGGWPGWYQLARDFIDDEEGFRQVRLRLKFDPKTPREIIDNAEASFILKGRVVRIKDGEIVEVSP